MTTTTITPVWREDRNNWSTTEWAGFRTNHPERFGPAEREQLVPGEGGWITIPVNGLTPDCEPVGARCSCSRSA